MHYGNMVIVAADAAETDLEAAVAEAMGPSEENGGFWDWYQIGGRWTGSLDGYDAEKDPKNIETCTLCGGTGKRTDMEVASGCNGCSGIGKSVKWPTQWAKHPSDVVPVSNLTEEHMKLFHRVVLPEGYGAFACTRYEPWQTNDKFPKQEMPPLSWIQAKFGDGYVAVVVDNHK